MTRYATLRTWALVLKVAGFFMVVLTLFGVVVWAFEADGFWTPSASSSSAHLLPSSSRPGA